MSATVQRWREATGTGKEAAKDNANEEYVEIFNEGLAKTSRNFGGRGGLGRAKWGRGCRKREVEETGVLGGTEEEGLERERRV